MRNQAFIKPTRQSYKAGIIVAAFFLAFGAFFFYLMYDERSVVGQVFTAFWMLIIVFIIGALVYNLHKYNESEKMTIDTIDMPDMSRDSAAKIPFDEKLRKLEQLKMDGLISSPEYDSKRAEILKEKW